MKQDWYTVNAVCRYCKAKEKVQGTSRAVGYIVLRQKGWRFSFGWVCPACVKEKR